MYTCPICGSAGTPMATSFLCSEASCANYVCDEDCESCSEAVADCLDAWPESLESMFKVRVVGDVVKPGFIAIKQLTVLSHSLAFDKYGYKDHTAVSFEVVVRNDCTDSLSVDYVSISTTAMPAVQLVGLHVSPVIVGVGKVQKLQSSFLLSNVCCQGILDGKL